MAAQPNPLVAAPPANPPAPLAAPGAANTPPPVLSGVQNPPPINVPAAPGAATLGTPTPSSSSAGPQPSPTAPQVPYPVAMLDALVNAGRTLEQLTSDAEKKAHKDQLDSVKALSQVTQLSDFETKVEAIKKADKALRTLRDQADACEDFLEHNGVHVIQKSRSAAEAVDRMIRGPQTQDRRPLEILRDWEAAARGGKPGGGKKAKRTKKAKAKRTGP